MLIEKFLILTAKKGRYNWLNVKARLAEKTPNLGQNEVALKIKLNVPEALFQRPTILCEMKIPDEAVPRATITPEITDNIEKIIKEATGLTMVVSVVEHEEKKPE